MMRMMKHTHAERQDTGKCLSMGVGLVVMIGEVVRVDR